MDSRNNKVRELLERVQRREISAEAAYRFIRNGGEGEPVLVYSRPEWRISACRPGPLPKGDILVFDGDGELYEALQRHWAARELPSVRWARVVPATTYGAEGDHYRLPPGDGESYRRLLDELGFRPGLIIHAWSEGAYTPERLAGQLELGVQSLFHLSRALLRRPSPEPVALHCLADAASPVEMALGGFARTLRREAPRYRCKVIAPEGDAGQAAARLLDEWGLDDEAEIRYQDGERSVRVLCEVPASSSAASAPWREGGVYLISGGLGGVGRQLAAHLLSRHRARLLLCGRQALNDELQARLAQLRGLGGEVFYLQTDVAERAQVEGLIASVRARYGTLHGVIHAAGVLRDSFLLKKEAAELQAVLKPKVWGTQWLDLATRELPLELFVLFSSASALMGNPGQADYAYANGFQDHYARWRAAQGGAGRSLSLNWPLWATGGMDIAPEAKAYMEQDLGLVPLRSASALRALEQGLQLETPQLMALEGDRRKMQAALLSPNEASVADRVSTEGETNTVDLALRQRVEDYLKALLSREIQLPVERIEAHEPFENYGIDSVVIVNLNRALEQRFGELSKTLFFEYPNLRKLVDYFAESMGDKLRQAFDDNTAEPGARSPAGEPLPGHPVNQERRSRYVPSARAHQETESSGIAIIGLAGRYPQARDLTEFWENLRTGSDAIEEIPSTRWNYRDYFDPDHERSRQPGRSDSKWGGFIDDVDRFDPLFFNIAPRDAEWIDPQERLFLQTVWQTVEDAGYTRDRLDGERVGLFVGVMYGEYQLYSVDRAGAPVLSASYASIANRASYFFNFNGPSMALDTMCSSSLTALHLACESIRRGECEYAVAGGVNLLLHPLKYLQLSQGGFASTDGRCRAFGEGGDGYVPGEGVGAVLLKPLARAVVDGDPIHGVIRATAVNHGGRTNGYTVPNPNAQAEVIVEALRRGGVEAESISYVEAHGTGTALGDPIEINGLSKAFGDLPRQSCAIGSVKSNIGHLESAAGIAALTKVLLQMRYRTLVPSLHAEPENPHINFRKTPFRVQREVAQWTCPVRRDGQGAPGFYPRRAGISSFGAGGSNVHVIVEEYMGTRRGVVREGEQLVVLSARNPQRLKAYAQALLCYLERETQSESGSPPSLADIAYTLQTGREAMEERLALVVSDLGGLQRKLEAFCTDEASDGSTFLGNISESKVDPMLLKGEEATAFMQALVQSRNLQKIAQLWLAGARVEWNRLWSPDAPARISLPVYPFAGDRYWAPDVSPAPGVKRSVHFDRIDYQASLEQGIVFEKQLHPEDPSVSDHCVNGRCVFPGVGQLLLAVAAAEAIGIERVLLRRVVWQQPLVVEESGTRVRIHLSRTEGEISFAILSQTDEQWQLRAKGEIASTGPNQDRERLPIAEWRQRIRSQVDAVALYDGFAELNLQYGPHYRTIENLWYEPDKALSRITATSPIAWLDGGLQTIAGLGMTDNGLSAAGIPFSVEEARIGGDPCIDGYACVLPLPGNRFDLVLTDGTGRIAAELRGVFLRPLPTTTESSRATADDERDGAHHSLLDSIVASATVGLPGKETAATYPPIEYFFRCLVLDAFRRLGVFEQVGERHEIHVLQNRMGVLPSYTRLYNCLLDILQQEKWVRRDGDFVTLAEAAFDPGLDQLLAEAAKRREALERDYPEMKTHIELLWVCLRAYPEVLTGKRNAVDVIFPEGSMKLVEKIYRGNEQSDRYNRMVADLVARYVSVKTAEEAKGSVRILEIGAGTGGTSAFVLPALQPYGDHVEYVYTDISSGFTHHGQALFGGDYPFAVFATLDIERDPVAQGFEAGSIDLVFASNVLHATRRIDDTLGHLRVLLKSGGLVLVNELTRVEDFVTLTFGLTDGWWRFEDEALRLQGGPLLSLERWVERLGRAGFSQARAVTVDGSSVQSLLAAEAAEISTVDVEAKSIGEKAQVEMQTTKMTSGHVADARENSTVKRIKQGSIAPSKAERLVRREPANYALQARTVEYLQDLFARVLKASRNDIGPLLTFDKLGIDSLLVSDITKELTRSFGKLPSTLLFEHPTVSALADYFLTHRRDAIEKVFSVAPETSSTAPGNFPEPKGASPTTGRPVPGAAGSEPNVVDTATTSGDEQEIAIIGLSGRYPGADNLEEFWENLCQGRDSISEVPADRWDWREFYDPRSKGVTDRCYTKWGGFINDADKFDAMFFSMSPKQADAVDPQERLFLETAWSLFEDAGITRRELATLDHNVGVFVGVMNNHYVRHGGNSNFWSIANRISYYFDLNGPSMAIDSACSSSLTALHLACESIRRGECQAAIAGGVNVITHPAHFVSLSAAGMVSPGATCRPFGEGSDGFVDGEGVGAVLLKSLADAVADGDHIYAVIKGSFVNASGRTPGYHAPNPNAQARVIENALQRSGIDPRTIGYIEAHGTGTALGDPIEISGLTKAFQAFTKDRQFCAVGSVKSNIGHLESAAGISALTKVLLQLKHKRLVPSLHAHKLNPLIDFDETPFYVQRTLAEWKPAAIEQNGHFVHYPHRAGISSFGAGGANVHVIVEAYTKSHSQLPPQQEHLIVLSARDEDRLAAYVKAMLGYLDRCNENALDLAEVAYTLQTGREAMEERLALIASSPESLRKQLMEFLSGNEGTSLFHGHVDAGVEKAELLTVGRAGNEFLRLVAQDRDLKRLARLWVWGIEVDWKLIYPAGFPSHISLPTYPFARERCWVSPASAVYTTAPLSPTVVKEKFEHPPKTLAKSEEIADSNDVDLLKDMIYVPSWKSRPLPEGEAMPQNHRVLIIHADNAETLVSDLRESHKEVFEIVLGARTDSRGVDCWEVASDEEDPYGPILSRIGAIDTVYHLGGIGSATPLELERINAGQEQGVIALFRLVKALVRKGYGEKPLLLKVVTQGAHSVREAEKPNPYGAALHGFVQSMAKEFELWQAVCIDLGRMEDEEYPSGILAEPGNTNGASIALREGKRYERRLLPVTLPRDGEMPIRSEGVYLIIGGGRGIGLELAKYLAFEWKARLVLVGRSEPDSIRKKEFARIEEAGGEVLYLRADAADPEQMGKAVAEAKTRYGHIDGVVHSALVLRDCTIKNMSERKLREALTPKIAVSLSMFAALKEENLDFILFFSSAQSFIANPGQSNYAAGCTFKDAFADALRAKGESPVVRVINWGYWGEVGAVAGDEYGKRMASLGIGAIKPREGMDAIRRLLAAQVPQALVFKGTREVLSAIGIDFVQEDALSPSSENADAPRDVSMPNSGENGSLLMRLKSVCADFMRIPPDKIDENKFFVDYGIDSIGSVMLVKKLEEQLERKIEPVALVNYPSIRLLCDYLKGCDPLTEREDTVGETDVIQKAFPSGLLSQLKELFADFMRLPPEKIDENKLFVDYGIDSIATVMLVKKLEELLSREIEPVALINHPTLTALSEHLAEFLENKLALGSETETVAPVTAPIDMARGEHKIDPVTIRIGPSYVKSIRAGLERGGDIYSKIKSLEQTLDRPASSYWSLSILAYFQSKGFLNSAETVDKDALRGSIGVSSSREYLFEAMLWSLKKNGLIAISGNQLGLSDKGNATETKRSVQNLPARRELLARTTPELESHARLFEVCLRAVDHIISDRLNPAELLFLPENRPLLEDVYRGDHRLSAVINAALSSGLEKFAGKLREKGCDAVRVLELGPATLSTTSSLFDTLHEHGFVIDHFFTGMAAGPISEIKVAIGAKEYPFVNFHSVALEDIEGTAEELKFDIVRINLPLLATERLERWIRLASMVLKTDGVVLLSDIAVTDLLSLTLGLVDNDWAFGLSSATQERSPEDALNDALDVLKESGYKEIKVLGRWLVASSPTEEISTTFVINQAVKPARLPVVPGTVALSRHTLLTSGQRVVEYFTCGQGEPVILLAAMAFDSSIWRWQIEAFADRYQLILPHLPGHGGSIFNGNSFSFEDLADDLTEIMDQLDVVKAHLVGWCMAGNIGQLMAVRHPQRLSSLSLICTTPTDARSRGIDGDDLAVYSDNPLMVYELEFQNIYGDAFYDDLMVESCLTHIRQCHAPIMSDAVLYYISNLFDFDTLGLLSDIHLPTLVIAGKWDIAFPPDQVRLLYEGIAESEFYVFAHSGHTPFLTEPERFNEILRGFLVKATRSSLEKIQEPLSKRNLSHRDDINMPLEEKV